nr:receptor-like serine/threonine-protein kinase SD1-8 [Ipomoea batatas]
MRAAMESGRFLFWYFLILQILIPRFTIAVDTITPTQPLAQNQTLVSAGGVFQLGFFSLDGNSGGLYVGIWYKEIQDMIIIWVANRDKPIPNSTEFLKIGEDGNINLVDGTRNSIWSSSNQSVRGNTIAQLLDSVNLVLRCATVRSDLSLETNRLGLCEMGPAVAFDLQKADVESIGFGGLLRLKVTKLPRYESTLVLTLKHNETAEIMAELKELSSKVATKIEDEVLRERSSSRSFDEINEESSRVIKFTIPKGELDNNEIHKLAKDEMHEAFLLLKRDMSVITSVHMESVMKLKEQMKGKEYVDQVVENFLAMKKLSEALPSFDLLTPDEENDDRMANIAAESDGDGGIEDHMVIY